MNIETILYYVISTIVFLAIARFLNQLVMRNSLKALLIEKDNPAVGIELTGYMLGVMIIISAVLTSTTQGTLIDRIIWLSIYGLSGLIFLVVIAEFGINIFIKGDILKSIFDGNIAAGIVLGGCYVANALVFAGAIDGEVSQGNSFLITLIFWLGGQLTLIIFTSLFRLLTSYSDSKEILDGNISAAVSYAGLMIAIGLIVKHAISGNFVDYNTSLIKYGNSMIIIAALYPIRQWVLQGLILGGGFSIYGGRLDKEISEDRNFNAGIVESLLYISTALLVVSLL